MKLMVQSLGFLGACLAVALGGVANAGSELFSVGPAAESPNTAFVAMNDEGAITSTGTVGYAIPGGVTPLTSPVTAVTFGNGGLYAIGPDPGTPYTDFYDLDTDGHVTGAGAVGYAIPGGLTPLASPLTALTFGNGGLYAIGPDLGTPYTAFYDLDTDGHITGAGAVGYAIPGGLTPLASPLAGLTFGNGGLYAIGPDLGTPYTAFYDLDTDGHITGAGAVGYAIPGGLTPYSSPLSALAFQDLGDATPEPASWLLMLLGFGALGSALRATREQPGSVSSRVP